MFAALIARTNIDFIALDKGEITQRKVVDDLIKKMEEYASLIRKKAKKNNVSFAIGYSIKKNGHEIIKAIKEADEAMYNDKRLFYEENKKAV